jgi:hypothetical protein
MGSTITLISYTGFDYSGKAGVSSKVQLKHATSLHR